MDNRDKILLLAQRAPLQPTQVAKALGVNSLIASAMLSEIVSKGQLKVSNIKIGSSPLYYLPEKAEHLQNYVNYLNAKDKNAYDLLKEKKVLRESMLDPLVRVAVKSIKDFSRPLEVTFGGVKEIFWKFYLLSDSDAEPIIKQLLNIMPEEPKQQPVYRAETSPMQGNVPATGNVQDDLNAGIKEEVKEETSDGIKERMPKGAQAEAEKSKAMPECPTSLKPVSRLVEQKRLVEKGQVKKQEVDISDTFLKQLLKFFQKSNITVIEQKLVKKKSDYEFVIELNSAVGALTYFCKAKNKKRIGEGDLSNAFVQGQLRKLPVILLSPGELTRQAKDIAKELKGVAVKKL